jgi:hypothetical protein
MIFARFLNVMLIRRRNTLEGKGAKEDEKAKGDLLVLLSQDRWVRIQGLVNDIKIVTAGHWLRSMTDAEEWVGGGATVIVFLNAALASNATDFGKFILITLLILSAGLLALANQGTNTLHMNGRVIRVIKGPQAYGRRLDMADELISEQGGRTDWAIRMGLVNPDYVPPENRTASDSSKAEQDRKQTDDERNRLTSHQTVVM